jgi:hydroxymethylbilane synthase
VKPTVRLGTRGSALALWQTEHVRALLAAAEPGSRFETVVISTKGDRLVDVPLPSIGGKGVFTEELERALRDRSIDLAVHSLKDLPTEIPTDLVVGAVLARVDPADALVSRKGFTLGTLPPGARVGTGSTRRRAQLLNYRPDLEIIELRGNADTRLRRARDPQGPYDAIVIAHAALARLGGLDASTELLPEEVMLPAPGQGALALECRAQSETLALVRAVNDLASEIETRAERAFLAALGGGCAVPVAARGRLFAGGRFELKGRICSPDGFLRIDVVHSAIIEMGAESAQSAAEAGKALAAAAIGRGAEDILTSAGGLGHGDYGG